MGPWGKRRERRAGENAVLYFVFLRELHAYQTRLIHTHKARSAVELDNQGLSTYTRRMAELSTQVADPALRAEIETALEREPERKQLKVRYTHDAMIDQIIKNPWVSQNDLAAFFGYTPAWVSTVINSDMFQAKLAQRRNELVDPSLRLSLEERFRAMTTRSLEVMQEKLARDASAIPDNLVLRAVELGAKALGVGGNAPPPATPGDHLSVLAGRLLQFQSSARKGEIHDQLRQVEVVEEALVLRETSGRAEASDEGESSTARQADGGGRQVEGEVLT